MQDIVLKNESRCQKEREPIQQQLSFKNKIHWMALWLPGMYHNWLWRNVANLEINENRTMLLKYTVVVEAHLKIAIQKNALQ